MGNFICGNQEQLNPGSLAQGKIPGILQRGPFANMRNKQQIQDNSLKPPRIMQRQRHRHFGPQRPLKLQQFASQMREGGRNRQRSYSWDTRTSHQQFSIRSFGKVCRDHQEKGQRAKNHNQQYVPNHINKSINQQQLKMEVPCNSIQRPFPMSRIQTRKRSDTLKKNIPHSKSVSRFESLSTKEDQEKLGIMKAKKDFSFSITRKLRSLGGFNNNDDNEMYFDCLGDETDKSADLTNNNKQSNGDLTFMPRTASKKEQDGQGLTFSDSEVEVEEEDDDSYYGGGRILCIRRGFAWPRRKLLSEEHKDEVVCIQKQDSSSGLSASNKIVMDANKDQLKQRQDSAYENNESDYSSGEDLIYIRNRANSECLECTGQTLPKLFEEFQEQKHEPHQHTRINLDNNVIQEEIFNQQNDQYEAADEQLMDDDDVPDQQKNTVPVFGQEKSLDEDQGEDKEEAEPSTVAHEQETTDKDLQIENAQPTAQTNNEVQVQELVDN